MTDITWTNDTRRSSPAVYLVHAKDTDLYKIGKAVDVGRRVAGLQTSCPYKLLVLAVVEGIGEKNLHARYKQFRQHGEWFCLPDSAVAEILEMATPSPKVPTSKGVTFKGASLSDEQRLRLIRNVTCGL